jgi:hypothetical protein
MQEIRELLLTAYIFTCGEAFNLFIWSLTMNKHGRKSTQGKKMSEGALCSASLIPSERILWGWEANRLPRKTFHNWRTPVRNGDHLDACGFLHGVHLHRGTYEVGCADRYDFPFRFSRISNDQRLTQSLWSLSGVCRRSLKHGSGCNPRDPEPMRGSSACVMQGTSDPAAQNIAH